MGHWNFAIEPDVSAFQGSKRRSLPAMMTKASACIPEPYAGAIWYWHKQD